MSVDVESLRTVGFFFTGVAGLIPVVLAVAKYLDHRRDQAAALRSGFSEVVSLLASDDETERCSGAILLRRFLRAEKDARVGSVTFEKEAVDVIAAVLREQEPGTFQKLLADGLSFAKRLARADLQRTNLQNAYLGSDPVAPLDLAGADFFRADLSRASLRNVNAKGAVFYEARLRDAVLKGSNLEGANFRGAELQGASFSKARLAGANFSGARSVPDDVAVHLDAAGVYQDRPSQREDADKTLPVTPRVFLSRPGKLTPSQEAAVAVIVGVVARQGLRLVRFERADYPPFGSLAEVRRVMGGCAGALIVGARELEVRSGVWRAGTPDEIVLEGEWWTTPWAHIEAGLAEGLGLPILLAREEGVTSGVFDDSTRTPQLERVSLLEDPESRTFSEAFESWCSAVRSNAVVGSTADLMSAS